MKVKEVKGKMIFIDFNNIDNQLYKGMRFILVYKYGILQTKTERIDVNFCENTSQLLDYLQKRVQQSKKNFIVKFRKGKAHLRIIADWSLNYYGLKEGTQLNIEFIQKLQQQNSTNPKYSNRHINNLLGINRSPVQQIQEEKQRQEEEEDEDFNVRKYLDAQCERMLKQIKTKSIVGFLNIFEHFPDEVPQSSLLEIKEKKMQIIDELGEKGWGAVHYAIFYQAEDIIDQLLDLQVDVNKCTSDGWLPIQLAIDLKSIDTIQKLLDDQNINLNLVTSKGSPIHTAARVAHKQILMMLLEKEVDIHLKDNSGKTAYQVCKDEECKKLLKKYSQKRQSYNEYIRGNLPLSLTTIFRGNILKAKRPFMNLKQRYLVVDPFQGSLIRYENFSDYPKKPKEVTPLKKLRGIKIIPQQQKSWHMKKQLSYFVIQEPNYEIYACKFRHTAQKWTSNLNLALKFAQELQKNPHMISDIKKQEVEIEDTQFDAVQKKKEKKKLAQNLFANSLLSRQSTLSNRSYDNNVQMAVHKNDTKKKEENNKKRSDEKQTRIEESPDNKVQSRKKQIKEQTEVLSNELNQITQTKVNFAAFNIIKTLGSGAFGKVFLVTHIPTGKQYALKALKKKNLIMQKQLKYAIIEANILKQANSNFIINLHFAFQTPHYLYLALDYCPGRDLSFHLARQVTFSQQQSRFYIAELIIAIDHLHSKKIIYRDLKPQNILLDEHGHIKLADFGLSKQTGENDKTKSFCGSPAYLSPEMLTQKGVGKESDLYGIGTVLYEFLIGQPPYFSDDIPTLYRNIKEGKLKFPKNVTQVAKSLILGLLERDPKKRLGHKGMHEIKQHPFFSTIDWQKLSEQKLKPPQRPSLEDSDASDDDMDIIKNKNPNFTDFDYDDSTKKINRLMNFSFIRQE